MKYMKTAVGALLLHLGVCLVEWIIWEWTLIDPMAGWDGYTLGEKSFFIILFALISAAVALLIKRKNTAMNSFIFWSVSILLTKVINMRIIFAELTDNLSFIYGTNWLGSDIWAVCFAACLLGTIVGVLWSIRNGVTT